MSLFSRFYGTLSKLLYRVNQSLVLRNLRNVTLKSCSLVHVDQVRNSPSKKLDIANFYEIYEIIQKRNSEGVLFLQIYCPSNCKLHSPADVPLGFFRKSSEQFFLRATLSGCFCQVKVC